MKLPELEVHTGSYPWSYVTLIPDSSIMAGLRSLAKGDAEPGLNSNFDVDYVIHYRVPSTGASLVEKAEAEASFSQLITALSSAGFATEVRPGTADSLLIFLKIASERLLRTQIYRSRLQDWLYGVRTSPPGKDLEAYFADEPISEAERLRLAYLLISRPKNEGGAGITAGRKEGQWRFVESVFPLHDHKFNRDWIARWSKKYTLDESDIDSVRDKFGEQVAFYFAFLQCYFTFLAAPAAVGFGAWVLLGQFSWLYAIANCLWSVVFFEYWRKREVDLAVQWGTRGVSALQRPRAQFHFEREAVDPVTGEIVKVWSPLKRLQRQLLQVPFALGCVVILGSLIVSCFSIEIFISEIYNGPFKKYLVFLPTVLLTVFMPMLTTLLTNFATQLTELENYETHDDHQASIVQKIFVINFITSYTPIFLTAFVYVPFGTVLVPYLDIFSVTAQRIAGSATVKTKPFAINPDRLTKQVIYFTVTAQIVGFVLETIVPYAKRKIFQTAEHVQEEVTSSLSKTPSNSTKPHYPDRPDEAPFLARVRDEATLPTYDVTVDYREMVVQFGYLSLFSCVWPLAACSFLANNWVEARGDAMKIAISSQRPIPWRADGIGPWLGALGFLSWLGSVTSSAIVYLFRNTSEMPRHDNITGWALLFSVLVSEHVYLATRVVVRYAISKVTDSPGLQREKAQRFQMRKALLAETLGDDDKGFGEADVGDVVNAGAGDLRVRGAEEITKEALEEEARVASVKGSGRPQELFWQRQRGAGETIQVGRSLISELHAANATTKK